MYTIEGGGTIIKEKQIIQMFNLYKISGTLKHGLGWEIVPTSDEIPIKLVGMGKGGYRAFNTISFNLTLNESTPVGTE